MGHVTHTNESRVPHELGFMRGGNALGIELRVHIFDECVEIFVDVIFVAAHSRATCVRACVCACV